MVGFAGALKLVPWATLIQNAPQIADRAGELVARARARRIEAEAEARAGVVDTLPQLETRVDALESQLVDAGRVIEGLAASNAALVASVDRMRRLLVLAAGLGGAGLIAGIAALLA